MEIVINISENIYNLIARGEEGRDFVYKSDLMRAILEGTPLPKEHGRLKDVDKWLTAERPKGIADDVWKESHIYKLLSNAPTIIEADKKGDIYADWYIWNCRTVI